MIQEEQRRFTVTLPLLLHYRNNIFAALFLLYMALLFLHDIGCMNIIS